MDGESKLNGSEYLYFKDIKSKYKYVQCRKSNVTGHIVWSSRILDLFGKVSNSKLYESERDAAIAVDINRINVGREPVNVLKRKQTAN
jgi:hypothetical protein